MASRRGCVVTPRSKERMARCAAMTRKWLPKVRAAAQQVDDSDIRDQVEVMESTLWLCDLLVPTLLRDLPEAAGEVVALQTLLLEMANALGGSLVLAQGVIELAKTGGQIDRLRVVAEIQEARLSDVLGQFGMSKDADGRPTEGTP